MTGLTTTGSRIGGTAINIKWYGTASLMLESGDTKILFDPFLKKWNPALPPFPLEECGEASAVFITHPHLDHFADIDVIRQHCSAPVYVAERGIQNARQAGFQVDRMHPIHAGETCQIGPFQVEIYRSRHCVFDLVRVMDTLRYATKKSLLSQGLALQRLNKRFSITKNDIFGFFVKAEEKEIFILGSANVDIECPYPTGIDLLVYPYQGKHKMASYSLQFLELFRPKRVMLDHFDDSFPPVSQQMDCPQFIRLAKENFPDMEVFEPRENVPYEI